MRIVESCEKCLYGKQVERAKALKEEEKRKAYLSEVKAALTGRAENDSAPYMVYVFNKIFSKYSENRDSYLNVKKEYNDLVMGMEAEIAEKIKASDDPLKTAMVYARIGNYIDYGAMNHVDKDAFLTLLEEDRESGFNQEVYESFCGKCRQGKTFLLLCDNCGEIVLDKLFIRQLKRRFPHLEVFAMVRGQEVLNDATIEDAVYCGLDKEAMLISSGIGLAGTVAGMLNPEAREVLDRADVVLAKGQGNYESMAGYRGNTFYSFLCKCDLFTTRFHVPKFTGMFVEGYGV